MNADSTQVTHPKRQAVRLSVRALMALVLLIGGGIGWVAYRARVQGEAVASINKAGGSVLYDWQFAGGTTAGTCQEGRKPWAPRWMVDFLGPDYFGTVILVNLEGCRTAEVLPSVAHLHRLETLILFMTDVTDERMSQLAGLDRLRELNLHDTGLGDAGLRPLECLPQLREIALPQFVTDAGLIRLGRMSVLRKVDLSGAGRCPLLTKGGLERVRIARPDLTIYGEAAEERD
ncbi:MAG: hypothetical protein ACLQIB_22020 [Isosphaeraceae bacterium]